MTGRTAELIPTETSAASERLHLRRCSTHQDLWALLDAVVDPELPGLSIWDIGVLQDIDDQAGHIVVTLTPTYSGCPAMQDITAAIHRVLGEAGFTQVEVKMRLLPPWTTDWLTSAARAKLLAESISPPGIGAGMDTASCPRCASTEVTLISGFSGTACRAMYRCQHCHEVFDHFKAMRL